MAALQNVLDESNKNTIFMVWNFHDDVDVKPAFQQLCGLIGNLNNSAKTRFPDAKASVVMGIGHDAWLRLDLPQPLPKELAPFEPIKGAKYTAVATRGDLHFHIRCDQPSYCFDIAQNITDVLHDVAKCVVDIQGFRYWDGRSILGFVDGTENPHDPEDRILFGTVGEEDPAYQGGSYLFVQKYVHDMQAWRALPLSEQEKVFGRSKADDIEMDDDTKPANSHSALANVGDDRKVIRDNMPFSANGEVGTYFIAYANTFSTVQAMLNNMFIGNPAGNYDRLLDFSRTRTGTLFFVPTLDMLDEFAG
ncbi:Dyp-type peroxidase [Avibacterium gallinarum]|uniref:Dyp-type peroxidase n=1 Tax=Avibacterium gallinarum TaxID=755 RepID=UPI0039FD8EF4